MASDRPDPSSHRPDSSNENRSAGAGGFFIAFEGPEGAGKTTQIGYLVQRLATVGIQAVCTREPGGTPAGDRIRTVILDPDLDVAPLTEFLLYSASRAQLVQDVIQPALARDDTVIGDRFAGASLAYQGYGRGIDRDFIRSLTRRVTGGLEPDLTLLLDVDIETGLSRVARRGARDRLERADQTFHDRVRRGFLEIARRGPSWRVLDASVSADVLAERIWRVVASHHPAVPAAAAPNPSTADDGPRRADARAIHPADASVGEER